MRIKIFEGEVVYSGDAKFIYVQDAVVFYALPFDAKEGDKVRITFELNPPDNSQQTQSL